MEVKNGWLKIDEWCPYPEKEIYVKTSWGETRKAKDCMFGFRLIDCTHPIMNCALSSADILAWRYVHQEDIDNVLFLKNHYKAIKNGEKIIESVFEKPKIKNIFKRFYQWLIKDL